MMAEGRSVDITNVHFITVKHHWKKACPVVRN